MNTATKPKLSVARRNAISPDGRLGATHAPKRIQVFDLATARELCRLPRTDDDVRAVAFAGSDGPQVKSSTVPPLRRGVSAAAYVLAIAGL